MTTTAEDVHIHISVDSEEEEETSGIQLRKRGGNGEAYAKVEKGDTGASEKLIGESKEFKDDNDKKNRSLFRKDFMQATGEADELDKSHSLTKLLAFAKPEQTILIIAIVSLLLGSVFSLMMPAVFAVIVDVIGDTDKPFEEYDALTQTLGNVGLGKKPRDILATAGITLGLLSLLVAIFSFIRGYLFNLAGEKVVRRVRQLLFGKLIRMEVGFFDMTRTGELINRLSSDTQILKNAVTVNISMGLRWGVTVLVGILYLFIVSWKLTLAMLGSVPIVTITAMRYGRKIRMLSKQTQDALALATNTAEESLSQIRTVRSFANEEVQAEKYNVKIERTYTLGATIAFYYGVFISFLSFVGTVCLGVVLWFGASLVIEGEMSTGVLMSFILYSITIGASLAGLSSLYGTLMGALGATQRVFQLLERIPLINTEGGLTQIPNFTGQIKFENVSFVYPSRPGDQVIRGLNLTCKAGTVTALVGESGGGKSTIIQLLERFYDLPANGKELPVKDGTIKSGSIYIDGTCIREIDPRYLHNLVGLIGQESVLFADTIRSNLTYGCVRKVSEDEIIYACKQANAYEFISSFPEGLDTPVGARGVRLSGGQRQRLCIARVLLTDAKILLCDEATSALDAESEFKVQQALDRLLAMNDKTVIVIAHRLSTVIDADTILVLKNGAVVEQGKHQELLAMEGTYASLVARQMNTKGKEVVVTPLPAAAAAAAEEEEEEETKSAN